MVTIRWKVERPDLGAKLNQKQVFTDHTLGMSYVAGKMAVLVPEESTSVEALSGLTGAMDTSPEDGLAPEHEEDEDSDDGDDETWVLPECPTCGAAAGKYCVTASGNKANGVHSARRAEADKDPGYSQ